MRLRTRCIGLALLLALTLSSWPCDAAITMFWRAEGTTLDGTADYTASDSTATAQGAPAINATAALVGSNGIQIDAASEYYHFTPTSIITPGAGSVGFYVRFQTWATGASTFYARSNLSANNQIQLQGTATDEFRLVIRDATAGAVNLDTTAVNVTNNTTYFVTFSWGTSLRRLRVYDSSGTLIEEQTSSAAYTQPAALDSASGLRFGEANGTSTAYYLDNLFVGSAYEDADTFYCNRNITSYANYAACSSGVTFYNRRARVNQ